MSLTLSLLDDRYVVCRMAARSKLPSWCDGDGFVSITRTQDELSVVCASSRVPRDAEGVKTEPGWRCLKLNGPIDFAAVGVLSSIARPLAEAGVAIFAVSTFETDYVLVKETELGHTVAALRKAGHVVHVGTD